MGILTDKRNRRYQNDTKQLVIGTEVLLERDGYEGSIASITETEISINWVGGIGNFRGIGTYNLESVKKNNLIHFLIKNKPTIIFRED